MNEKRSVLLSIRATPGDVEKFKAAAQKLWPGAPISRSSAVLSLARLMAETVLKEPER